MAGTDPITRDLYDAEQAGGVPADALLASFGCGNPTALAVAKLKVAGFTDIEVEPTRIYTKDDTDEMASSCCGEETEAALKALDGSVMSAFIRAKKP